MFDLSKHSYNEVIQFLDDNEIHLKDDIQPCVHITLEQNSKDTYELILISMSYDYYDNPKMNFNVTYDKCFYYILKYSNEDFINELSVIDCGGYNVGVCIFKNKINITDNYIYNKNKDGNNTAFKYHMNTIIGNKNDIIPMTRKL